MKSLLLLQCHFNFLSMNAFTHTHVYIIHTTQKASFSYPTVKMGDKYDMEGEKCLFL